MRQDYVSVFNKLLVIVFGVMAGVFLLFIAVGGKQMDYNGLSSPIMDGYSFVYEPIELNIDCNTEGLRVDGCFYPEDRQRAINLQPAATKNQYQQTIHGQVLQSQGETDARGLHIVQ